MAAHLAKQFLGNHVTSTIVTTSKVSSTQSLPNIEQAQFLAFVASGRAFQGVVASEKYFPRN